MQHRDFKVLGFLSEGSLTSTDHTRTAPGSDLETWYVVTMETDLHQLGHFRTMQQVMSVEQFPGLDLISPVEIIES